MGKIGKVVGMIGTGLVCGLAGVLEVFPGTVRKVLRIEDDNDSTDEETSEEVVEEEATETEAE